MSSPDAPSPHRAAIGASVSERLTATRFVTRLPQENAQIFHLPHFLTGAHCRQLIRLIEGDAYPSRVYLGADRRPDFRTSDSCDFRGTVPEVAELDRKLSALLGQPASRGEAVQGQRYRPGQHFLAHHDYFRGDMDYWPEMARTGGQRTWTAMIYLNNVEEGGATRFHRAGIQILPATGLLLVWNNMRPDGSPNIDTLHEGAQVAAGVKYVVTKWYREFDWIDVRSPRD